MNVDSLLQSYINIYNRNLRIFYVGVNLRVVSDLTDTISRRSVSPLLYKHVKVHIRTKKRHYVELSSVKETVKSKSFPHHGRLNEKFQKLGVWHFRSRGNPGFHWLNITNFPYSPQKILHADFCNCVWVLS